MWAAAPRLLVGTIALQVVSAAATVAAVVLGGRLAARLAQVSVEGTDALTRDAGLFIVVSFVAVSSSLIKAEYHQLLAERAEQHATDVVLDAAVRAELIEYEQPAFHDRMIRALASASGRPAQLTFALLGLVSSGITVVGLGAALFTVAPWLVLVVAVGAVPLFWTARNAARRSYRFNLAQSERDRRHGYFVTALASRTDAAEIRVYGIGGELRRRVRDLHGNRIDDLRTLVRTRTALGLLGALLTAAVAAVVLFTLASFLDSGRITLDRAAIATAAFLVLSERLQTLNSSAASVLECALFLEDIERFAPRHEAIDRPQRPEPIHSIALHDVSFQYPAASHPAINTATLKAQRGEVLALVGENGSGKSTLAKILALLYAPTSGAVLVNGEPMDPDDAVLLRERIAVVHQDFLRLLMTARENIALGDLDAEPTDERVDEAAQFGGIARAITSMPQSYDTMLGTEFSGGLELSGGQWQRIAIARAWFRNADVIILDEPTSALDPSAEIELIARVHQLAKEKVVILISHRFGTVSTADRIAVLHAGSVVETGTHSQLMKEAGVYASLYSLQAASFQRSDPD